MSTSSLKLIKDFLENLVRRLTLNTENGIDVRVVSATLNGKPVGEFLVVELTVAVFVIFAEDGIDLVVLEKAANGLEGLSELIRFNSTVTIEVEMFENATNSLTFIVSAVSSLSNFLKDDVLKLSKSAGGNISNVGVETPGLEDNVDEVAFLLLRQDAVEVSVVINKGGFRDASVFTLGTHTFDKVLEHSLSLLLTSVNTWVSRGVVFLDKVFERDLRSTVSKFVECVLDDSEALLAHISSKALNKLTVLDLTILVQIEAVIDDTELLTGQKDTNL